MKRWSEQTWMKRRSEALDRLRPVVEAHLDRASRHEKHPVIDFLFQYYAFRPSQLMTWSPGAGAVLETASGDSEMPSFMERVEGGYRVCPEVLSVKRLKGLEWVLGLLKAVDSRPPKFGCFGLHEWAMVYQLPADSVRHAHLPLRVSQEQIHRELTSGRLACTHWDAFRFFTPKAAPLNPVQPESDKRYEQEQGGCIHANMDLYKWASKYWPLVSTDRIIEAFELALDARWIDMRASPYDLSAFQKPPIRIETSEGRKEYQAHQEQLAKRAIPIRKQLIQDLEAIHSSMTGWVSRAG